MVSKPKRAGFEAGDCRSSSGRLRERQGDTRLGALTTQQGRTLPDAAGPVGASGAEETVMYRLWLQVSAGGA